MAADEHKRVLPFRGYYFFNFTASPTFETTYVINALVGSLGCSTIAGATGFSLVFTIHGAAKFSIIQNDFQTLKSASNKDIRKCILRHQECIRY